MFKKQISLAISLMVFSFATYANNVSLSCPPVDLVKQVWDKMDDAIPNDRTYIVTSKPIISFSEHMWSARTTVPARNQDDAIKLAQIVVKEVSALMTANPIKILNQYGCVYFSPRAYVYALTDANL